MQNPDISSQNQPQYDPEHEEKKKKQSKIMKEIQRLLSDDNLKRDKNLLNLLQKNQTHSLSIDDLLSLESIKSLGAKKDDILSACANSNEVTPTGDGCAIMRKGNPPLPTC